MVKKKDEKMKLTEGMFIVGFNTIRKFFEAIAGVDSECRLHIGKEGVYALVVDCQNREMIQISIDRFKTIIGPSEPVAFCIEVSAINRVLKSMEIIPETDATFRWDESVVFIEIGRTKLYFNILGNHTVRTDPNSPVLETGRTSFTVLGSVLLQGLQIANVQSDTINLTTNRDSAFLQWRGDMSRSEYSLTSCKTTPEKAKYSIDALLNMAKVLVNAEVTVSFKTDYPVKITANDKGGLPEGLNIIYLLAPRVESD